MYIHESAFLGLERIVKMLKEKKVNNKKRIHFTLKDAAQLSPMAVSIMMQLNLETVKDGKLGQTNRGRS